MPNLVSQISTDVKHASQNNALFAKVTYGWWVFIGCTGAILLAGTPVAPFVFGIMTIASLYQLEHLVTHS